MLGLQRPVEAGLEAKTEGSDLRELMAAARSVMAGERQESVAAFLSWALRLYKRLGITLRRVMTGKGSGSVSRALAKACAAPG